MRGDARDGESLACKAMTVLEAIRSDSRQDGCYSRMLVDWLGRIDRSRPIRRAKGPESADLGGVEQGRAARSTMR
jgi:hypothetical protein